MKSDVQLFLDLGFLPYTSGGLGRTIYTTDKSRWIIITAIASGDKIAVSARGFGEWHKIRIAAKLFTSGELAANYATSLVSQWQARARLVGTLS